MEGPYRDLGAGFARLAGVEGLRRAQAPIRSVEDALFELLRNARDAGAENIFVASILNARRYRSLTVIDDGRGIPKTHAHLVFEPGVTTRHLAPVRETTAALGKIRPAPHGAGLSLHHIKRAAVSAEVLSAASPTAIRAVFDTREGLLREGSLQSASKPSKSSLPAVLANFARSQTTSAKPPALFYGSPASILARLLDKCIIRRDGNAAGLHRLAESLGLGVSLRTAQRVLTGGVAAAGRVGASSEAIGAGGRTGKRRRGGSSGAEGPILTLGDDELEELGVVLRRVARASYLDLSGLAAEGRPGEIVIKARVYEPEEEYDDD